MVAIELRRKSGVPLYVQLKERIRQQAVSGAWDPGFKLPTERELSTLLSVSRNTVSQAYRELEREGILVSLQGKGTFLSEADSTLLSASRVQRLEVIVDDALGLALQEGFDCEEFRDVAHRVSMHKQLMLSEVRIVFIECNREQVDYFSTQLVLGSGISIAPMLLEELLSPSPLIRRLLDEAEIIVTTFFHEKEVRAAVGADKQIIAVALEPQLETVVSIARIPRQKNLALFCMSMVFAEKVQASLLAAGVEHRLMVSTLADDEDEVRAKLKAADILLVSPGRKREISALCPSGKDIIEFVYRPDIGSSKLLQNAILRLREGGSESRK